eukprot:3940229-Ditylum_brightwellii.AAC.1
MRKHQKKGGAGYNPAYKCDYLWKTIVNNVNAVTKQACLDLTGDKISWGHQGWGKSGSDDMIIGESMEENKHIKEIFTTTPGITFDNYFSGDNIFDYAGQKGF